MEVYTPIPEEFLYRTPHAFRVAGTVVRVLVLLVVAAAVLRFAFEAPPPDFRNFGVVNTQAGTAEVVCGGEFTTCGDTTALVFPSCNLGTAWRMYFGIRDGQPSGAVIDASVRRLLGARPPSGTKWTVTCRDAYPLGDRIAKLKSL